MTYYKSWRIGKDGKPGWRIVDETGNVVDGSPNKDELRCLEYEKCRKKRYTDEELLNFLIQFDKENGRTPMQLDFEGIPVYPSSMTYRNRFGSWNKALEKVGLDTTKGLTQRYNDEELLRYLVRFNNKNGRPPTEDDFSNNSGYPSFGTYIKHFGSWEKAKKLVGLDTDTMVEKGVLDTSDKKARLAERIILDHFEKNPVDLSGENKLSPCDGICPNGKTYDVKSSKFDGMKWHFNVRNKHKDDIEIYYFLAFNEDWTKLKYGWRVPGEIVEKDYFYVGLENSGWEFTIDDMKKYDITDKLDKIQEKGIEKVI